MSVANRPRKMRSSTFRIRAALVVSAVAVVVLAACGSSTSKNSAPKSNGTASTPTSGGAASNAATVLVSNSAKLGPVLTDANGMTLYTLTNANHPVACTGQCATFWPPLLLPAGVTTATGGAGVNGLATVSANGGMQVVQNGDPLYRFSRDKAPGDVNGEGIASFGGIWHVATTTRSATGGSNTTTTPRPASHPTSSGGGYGY